MRGRFVSIRQPTQIAGRLSDVAAIGVLLTATAITVRPLLSGRDAATGAGDWHAQAFRVDEIGRHGLASWSHTWAGGMPLWEGYQAVPHLLTLAVVRATGLQTTIAMLVLVACLVMAYRFGTYAALRWAGAPPAAALAGVLTVAALDSLRQPAANYSELWGLALTPVALFAGLRWSGRPGGYLVATLIGLSVEVHPLLAVTGGLAMAAGFVSSPRRRSVRMLAVQGALAATGAAVFWFPMLVSSRPAYGEPYFASVAFSRLLFRLSTAGFLPGWPLFMVAAVLVCVAALHGARSGASARYLLLMGGAVALITAAGLASGTPEAVYGAQLVRLVGVVPLVIGGAAALAATAAVRTGAGREAVWLTAIALAALAAVRGVAGPLDVTRSAPAAPPILEAALAAAGRTDGRIWLDPVATARLSFLSGGSAQLAGSYSGREWSLLHGPLEYFLAGHGSARNRAAYLLAHAVGVLVVPSGLRPAIVDPRDGDTPASWHTVASDDGLDVIAPPWRAAAAWALPASLRREVAVPDLRFRDVEGSYIRDDHVARLAAAAARGTDTPIRVRYPSGGAIAIEITSLETGRFLVVSENWDRHWQATAVGRRLTVERVGPNLLGVDVGDLSGAVVVNLTHTQPGSAPAGLAVSLVSLVAGAALTLTQGRAQAGKPLEGAIGKRKRY